MNALHLNIQALMEGLMRLARWIVAGLVALCGLWAAFAINVVSGTESCSYSTARTGVVHHSCSGTGGWPIVSVVLVEVLVLAITVVLANVVRPRPMAH